MEAICSSETSFDFQRTTRRYIQEDGTLHNHRCENLKSYYLLTNMQKIRVRNIDVMSPKCNVAEMCIKWHINCIIIII
jgi:hypothetical protein